MLYDKTKAYTEKSKIGPVERSSGNQSWGYVSLTFDDELAVVCAPHEVTPLPTSRLQHPIEILGEGGIQVRAEV